MADGQEENTMSVHVVETAALKTFSPEGVHSTPMLDTGKVRARLLNLNVSQAVAPCQMPSPVLYYVIEGQGYMRVDREQAELQAGSLVVVPADAVRTILAAEPMLVLAVQVL
jgi:quercetin dioxygenase-like cupin family protein